MKQREIYNYPLGIPVKEENLKGCYLLVKAGNK